MSDNKHIEDQIMDPANRSVIGYVSRKVSSTENKVVYFIKIENINRGSSSNIYIGEDEVSYYRGLVESSNRARVGRKEAAKEARRVKAEKKAEEAEKEVSPLDEVDEVGGEDLEEGNVEEAAGIDIEDSKIEDIYDTEEYLNDDGRDD